MDPRASDRTCRVKKDQRGKDKEKSEEFCSTHDATHSLSVNRMYGKDRSSEKSSSCVPKQQIEEKKKQD